MIKVFSGEQLATDLIFMRGMKNDKVEGTVSAIIDNVSKNGDKALFEYCKKFDNAEINELEVSDDEIESALALAGDDFLKLLKQARNNVEAFHVAQRRAGYKICSDGKELGQLIMPIEKVGMYVPGGTASYPSTVLMNCVPAKLAGVNEIIMVSPPDSEGKINADILAAAYVAGVDRIFKIGGAQAIAALAYGTESVPKVDKIVGPGNAYVAEAKKQVFGSVSIDMIAGPSEILIVADESCNAEYVAADMLSQAEHDALASAVLVTDSVRLANAVQVELERQLTSLERQEIARKSIDNNGKIIIVNSIEEAIEISNRIAPEHLEICVDEPMKYLDSVRNAGSVFLGKYCPEALGDYFAGTNHTLPTSGTARFSSALSVDDFVKTTQYVYYEKRALEKEYKAIDAFAKREGLTAHAKSVTVRFDEVE